MTSVIALLVLSTIHSARAADYTGDGIDDLVISVPDEDFGALTDAGGIHVIRGSTSGLSTARDAFIHQGTAEVPSTNDDEEHFGHDVDAGDVDGDGVTDLIVSAPYDVAPGGRVDGGAIWRLELTKSTTGLTVADAQLITQDTVGVIGNRASGDEFGFAVVVADFDGDGYDDVVVGIPSENVGPTAVDAGAVTYFPGSESGLTATGHIYYDQNAAGVVGSAETEDHFGDALAAGDFDGDGYADLAIGISGENWTGVDEGAIQILYGGETGPQATSPNDQLFSAGVGPFAGTMQDYNDCGEALTVGDFDGDGYDDLAIGCPGYNIGGGYYVDFGAGAVLVVYGSSSGLDDSELWTQDSPGIASTAEDGDDFGRSLTSGDYNGDGNDDLAVGTSENVGFYHIGAGSVHVIPGSASGLTATGSLVLMQDAGDLVRGTPNGRDFFGWAVTSGDWNDDGLDDLAVGSVNDDRGVRNAGAVNVFYGSASGPSTFGDQFFHQGMAGIAQTAESGDDFGYALR